MSGNLLNSLSISSTIPDKGALKIKHSNECKALAWYLANSKHSVNIIIIINLGTNLTPYLKSSSLKLLPVKLSWKDETY